MLQTTLDCQLRCLIRPVSPFHHLHSHNQQCGSAGLAIWPALCRCCSSWQLQLLLLLCISYWRG